MHGGDSLSLEKFCQKYQARVYSIYWKHRMRITDRAEKEEALPHGTRLIDLDTFRKRLQSSTHIVSQVNVRTHSEKNVTGVDIA